MTPSALRDLVILRRLTADGIRLEDLVESAYQDVTKGRELYPVWRTSHGHIEENIKDLIRDGLIERVVREGKSLIALSHIGELHIERSLAHSPTRKQIDELVETGVGETLES